jgi:methanogenic corrinoid protein MtbC1
MRAANPKTRHSIQIVANRTGLTPDVIRAWERRYEAVRPERSETRRRFYTDDDVERLKLLRRATLTGRRIGEVAQLSHDDLLALIKEDSDAEAPPLAHAAHRSSGVSRSLEDCLLAARELDGRALEYRLERAAIELDLESLFEGVLTPLLRQVGDEWLRGSLSIVHEHMTTSLVRSLLDSLRRSFSNPRSTLSLIATTPTGQHHELGALKIAVTAAVEGWRSTYLGSNLPAQEIAGAARDLDARVVALSIVYPEQDAQLEREIRLLGELVPSATRIIAGGPALLEYESQLRSIGASVRNDLWSFRRELRSLASGTQRTDRVGDRG